MPLTADKVLNKKEIEYIKQPCRRCNGDYRSVYNQILCYMCGHGPVEPTTPQEQNNERLALDWLFHGESKPKKELPPDKFSNINKNKPGNR